MQIRFQARFQSISMRRAAEMEVYSAGRAGVIRTHGAFAVLFTEILVRG